MGTKRHVIEERCTLEEEANASTSSSPVLASVAVAVSEPAATLSFIPATLTFRNISYDVTHSQTKKTVRLLRGITGLARPGTMTALMGASGAGE